MKVYKISAKRNYKNNQMEILKLKNLFKKFSLDALSRLEIANLKTDKQISNLKKKRENGLEKILEETTARNSPKFDESKICR